MCALNIVQKVTSKKQVDINEKFDSNRSNNALIFCCFDCFCKCVGV